MRDRDEGKTEGRRRGRWKEEAEEEEDEEEEETLIYVSTSVYTALTHTLIKSNHALIINNLLVYLGRRVCRA